MVWLIVLAAVVGLLLCGSGITGLVLLASRSDEPEPSPTTAGPVTTETSQPTTPAPATTRITVGDCVRNPSATANFELEKVSCGPGALLVLARFDGTEDRSVCRQVPNSEVVIRQRNAETFVLCLRNF